MKTTDGHDIKKFGYYYLGNGQGVMLNTYGTTSEGKNMYVVIPFYEGQAMSANGDGGQHNEVTIDYEHEGDEMLVTAIFKDPPMDKLETRYKQKLSEIEKLSLSAGLLTSEIKKMSREKDIAEKSTKESYESFLKTKDASEKAKDELKELENKVSASRQLLSETEDSTAQIKNDDVSTSISKIELQELNERDFKLTCLEAGGVDNWDWFDDSLKDYRERYPG